MASKVAGLLVTLGLDASEYVSGLTKATNQATSFSRRTQSAFSDLARFVGGLALGATIFAVTKEIIANGEALNNLAADTGSSVEALSKLSNTAAISGTNFDRLQTLILKLSSGMGDLSGENNKVARALQFLGVTAKDPAQALNDIAIALSKYKDGAGKAAIAQDLFGKGGAAFLSTLKDIANNQDAVATTTKKQAEEAEELGKAFRRLSVEATGFRNAILNDVVPALTSAISSFNDARRASNGFLETLRVFTHANAGLGFETEEEAVKRLTEELEKLQKVKESGGWEVFGKRFFGPELSNITSNIATTTKALLVAEAALARTGRAGFQTGNRMNADRAVLPKPDLNFTSTPDAKKIREAVSEAQRYIDSLTKQLEKTEELTVAEQLWRDFSLGRIKDMTAAQFAQADSLARQIDASNALTKEIEASAKAFEEEKRAMEASNREREHATKTAQESADQVHKANETLRDEIAIILGGDAARKALEKDYVERAIAIKEALAAELSLTAGMESQVEAINIEIAALKERAELLKGRDFAEALAAEAKNLQEVKNALSDALVDPLTDFITGTKSAKDAFKSFTDDLTRQLSRLASQNIANMLFGGKNASGPDFFAVLGKLFGMFAGAGGGAGQGYGTIGSSIPAGPYPYASGTNFHPGGMAMVGEAGPEILNLPRGAQVIPMNDWRKAKGTTNVFHVNVMPGANAASVRQTKAMLRDAVMSSARDR